MSKQLCRRCRVFDPNIKYGKGGKTLCPTCSTQKIKYTKKPVITVPRPTGMEINYLFRYLRYYPEIWYSFDCRQLFIYTPENGRWFITSFKSDSDDREEAVRRHIISNSLSHPDKIIHKEFSKDRNAQIHIFNEKVLKWYKEPDLQIMV